jgi:hypothetical protein
MADGGIGEMALMDALIGGAETGAVIGGGKSLLTGEDPLRGALMGGLMGGATGGLLNGIMPGAEAVTPSTPVASSGAITPTSFANAPMDMTAYAPTPTQFGAFGEAPSTVGSTLGSGPSYDYSAFTGAPPGGTASVADAAQRAASQGMGTSQIQGLQTPPVGSTNPISKYWDTLSDKQKLLVGGAGVLGVGMLADRNKYGVPAQAPYTGALSRFNYNPDTYRPSFYAEGGITSLNTGGNMMVGGNPMDPTDTIERTNWQEDAFPAHSMASGGIASLGSYSDGGHMLKGPGDGMSDSIPATIADKRPARLATDEFVVPADVVSHLGNGSSDAGAKQLYAMMNRVRKARTGNPKQGREINAGKYMPA